MPERWLPTILYVVAKHVDERDWCKIGATYSPKRIQNWTGRGWTVLTRREGLPPPVPRVVEREILTDLHRMNARHLSKNFMPYGGQSETFEAVHLDFVMARLEELISTTAKGLT